MTQAAPNCRFYVTIEGAMQAVFTEVSGLQIETDVTDHPEGGNNGFVHRLPGRTRVNSLTLKRGLTGSNELLKWYLRIAGGTIDRRNLSVIQYDVQGNELIRWNFVNAYPIKWVGPQFAAEGAAVSLETLELAHEGMQIQ